MNIEKTIARMLDIAGLAMAVIFALAIVLDLAGTKASISVVQLGICFAIAIPVLGVIVVMIMLFKKRETKYGVCAIILLILLIFTVIWRMLA